MTTTTSSSIPDLPQDSQQTVILALSPDFKPTSTYKDQNNYNLQSCSGITEKDKVLEPFRYVWSMKGKNFRKHLGLAFNHWFGVTGEPLKRVLNIVDKLHNASLVIDDIEDSSDLRRGRPAAHVIYGIPMAINAANYMFVEVLRNVLEFESLKAVKIFTEQLISAHHGQGMELYWRDCHNFQPLNYAIPTYEVLDGTKASIGNNKDGVDSLISDLHISESLPTEKEYQEVIVKKTSGLFLLLVQLLRDRSPKPGTESIDPTNLIQLMGLCFQVRDDLMNLTSSEYKDSKGFCEDISEGKLSFPVVHALNKISYSLEKRRRLATILGMRKTDDLLKEEALQILKESGAITYTQERLVGLKAEISREILSLGGNPKLEQMLAMFWG